MIRRLINIAALTAAGVFAAKRLRRSSRLTVPEEAADAGPDPRDRGSRIKRRARDMGVLLAVLAVGGFLVAASGLVPITASSGHWAITRWFLSFSMHRSVATHTIGHQAAPPLDDPDLVLKGAGHYETGCRPCHGSPRLRRPRIAQEMTAQPPYLPSEIPKWEPDELFYIVKHGVKFTGMPAWPARQRDDEVWAVVAFLLTLPDLGAEGYEELVKGSVRSSGRSAPIHDLVEPDEVPGAVTESCGRCHGIDGLGRGTGAFPRLAGQRPTYLYAALQAYAQGRRRSGMMEPIAAELSREEMRELARYYGHLDRPPPTHAPLQVDAEAVERGRAIAHEGIPSRGVPSCVDCHGPGDAPRNPFYPVLAGQYASYLLLQLELFKKDHRGGSAYAHLMHPTADRLTPEQMRDVARYYESLASDRD